MGLGLSGAMKKELVEQIRDNVVLVVAMSEVRQCEDDLKRIPQSSEIPATEDRLFFQLTEFLLRKAQAYDRIALITKAHPRYD